jgi:hypothetical protein
MKLNELLQMTEEKANKPPVVGCTCKLFSENKDINWQAIDVPRVLKLERGCIFNGDFCGNFSG